LHLFRAILVFIIGQGVSIILGLIAGPFASSYALGALYGAAASFTYHAAIAIYFHSFSALQPTSVLIATLGMSPLELIGYWLFYLVGLGMVFGALSGAAGYGIKMDLRTRMAERKAQDKDPPC
jgi:hypothetical protein